MNEIRYFSMFTGVGGFEVGLKNASNSQSFPTIEQDKQGRNWTTNEQRTLLRTGPKPAFTCVGMSEWDKYSSQVLKYRFPSIKNWGDCTKIRPEDLPDFDMLCGGFPCQAFSIAGKRRGFEDTRGTMFFEVARILEVKRPKIVLLENVKGLLNHNKGETFSVILEALDELGYEVQWMVLNSKFFGVPQNRERVLIIGSLRGERRPEILPFKNNLQAPYELHKQQDYTNSIQTGTAQNRQGSYVAESSKSTQESRGCATRTRAYAGIPERLELRKDNIANQITSVQKDSMAFNGFSIRRLTPVECCRLQGFPDDWNEFGINEQGETVKMSDTQRYKQMGNAVTTKVIQAIGERLATHLTKQTNHSQEQEHKVGSATGDSAELSPDTPRGCGREIRFDWMGRKCHLNCGIIDPLNNETILCHECKTKQTNSENFDEGDTICASDVYKQTPGEKE